MASRESDQSGEAPTLASGGTPVVEARPEPASPGIYRLPLAISFQYRGRQVLCTPVWDDAGGIPRLTFACPLCGRVQNFQTPALVSREIDLCIQGCVRCVSRDCGFHVVISGGLAEDAPGHN